MSQISLPFSESVQKTIEDATVDLETGGRGVLIANDVILTATHCFGDVSISEVLFGGDRFPIKITESSGRSFVTVPIFADLVSDIAALGPMHEQAFVKTADGKWVTHPDAAAMRSFWQSTVPVELCTAEPHVTADAEVTIYEPIDFPVYVLTHDQGWIEAASRGFVGASLLLIESKTQRIDRGTSGGPIVTEKGQLIGVVSNVSDQPNGFDGTYARPNLLLPDVVKDHSKWRPGMPPK